MAHCPAYQGPICSLCCTLDARCGDLCKPQASLSAQWTAALHRLLPRSLWPFLDTGLAHFLLLMLAIVPVLAGVFGLLYRQELQALAQALDDAHYWQAPEVALRSGFVKAWEEHSVAAEHARFLELLERGAIFDAANFLQDVHWSFAVQEPYIHAYYFASTRQEPS